MPESDEYKVPDEDKNKVMHVGLSIGKSVLMGSDNGSAYESSFIQGNNFSVSVTEASKTEAETLFKALSADGQITMPMDNTFWGDYFGMLMNKFGINWMISFNENYKD